MREGINRDRIGHEVNDLTDAHLVTVSKTEARELIDKLPETLAVALDYAQGEDREDGRYVVIYVTP